jgi:hypothetical protein
MSGSSFSPTSQIRQLRAGRRAVRGRVQCARVGKLIVASADAHRPPGRESVPVGEDRLPTWADLEEMGDAYVAVVLVAHRSVAKFATQRR